jgi:hypothetical protein
MVENAIGKPYYMVPDKDAMEIDVDERYLVILIRKRKCIRKIIRSGDGIASSVRSELRTCKKTICLFF